jgi:hypothetical protein
MFEELSLNDLRELLRQLETRKAETERLIREVTGRIDAAIPNEADLERRREPRRPSVTPEPE